MRLVWRVLLLTALAWASYVAHNLVDLPGLSWTSPEYSIVSAIYAVLFLLWCIPSRVTRLVFLGWVWLQILGGGLVSVLPLPFLPFEPAQTPLHYAMHGLLIVGHLPLVGALRRARA